MTEIILIFINLYIEDLKRVSRGILPIHPSPHFHENLWCVLYDIISFRSVNHPLHTDQNFSYTQFL